MRRQQGGNFEYEDESRGMMIDYSDHQPYREGSSTPVLDGDEELVDDELGVPRGNFKITEVGLDEDYSPVNSDQYDDYDPQEHYDIRYGSGKYYHLKNLSLKSPTFTNEMSRNQNILLIVGANIHIYTLRGQCLILTTSYKLGCCF